MIKIHVDVDDAVEGDALGTLVTALLEVLGIHTTFSPVGPHVSVEHAHEVLRQRLQQTRYALVKVQARPAEPVASAPPQPARRYPAVINGEWLFDHGVTNGADGRRVDIAFPLGVNITRVGLTMIAGSNLINPEKLAAALLDLNTLNQHALEGLEQAMKAGPIAGMRVLADVLGL